MNALKAVSKTDDTLTVENHIILFGGRDLEGKVNDRANPDGTRGEFFSKATDLRSPYTNTGVLYVDWEHGQAGKAEPQEDDILGFVDWTTAKADDEGIVVRRILDRRHRFIQLIEPLIEEGLIGTSSEAVPTGVQKADTGEILRWPLRRDTLTVTPMEPRMLSANALQAAKALGERWPALKAAIIEDVSRETLEQNQSADDAVENTEQPTDEVAQNEAPAVQSETTPEPDNTELIAMLGQFIETITPLLRGNNHE